MTAQGAPLDALLIAKSNSLCNILPNSLVLDFRVYLLLAYNNAGDTSSVFSGLVSLTATFQPQPSQVVEQEWLIGPPASTARN